jgi:hypothetical protein
MVYRRETDNTMVNRRGTDNTMVYRRGTDNTMDKRKEKDKRININLQNTAQKTKDRATGTSRKGGANSCSPEG